MSTTAARARLAKADHALHGDVSVLLGLYDQRRRRTGREVGHRRDGPPIRELPAKCQAIVRAQARDLPERFGGKFTLIGGPESGFNLPFSRAKRSKLPDLSTCDP
jgi:hypothetical protein